MSRESLGRCGERGLLDDGVLFQKLVDGSHGDDRATSNLHDPDPALPHWTVKSGLAQAEGACSLIHPKGGARDGRMLGGGLCGGRVFHLVSVDKLSVHGKGMVRETQRRDICVSPNVVVWGGRNIDEISQ